jgi:hypothetical protein
MPRKMDRDGAISVPPLRKARFSSQIEILKSDDISIEL